MSSLPFFEQHLVRADDPSPGVPQQFRCGARIETSEKASRQCLLKLAFCRIVVGRQGFRREPEAQCR